MDALFPKGNPRAPDVSAIDSADGVRAPVPVRRTLTVACAVVAVGAAALLVLGVDCAIYLALWGEPPSVAAVLHQASQWICRLLRACSA